MSTLTAPKPAKKTSAAAAASKVLTQGETIVKPPTDETPGSGTTGSKKSSNRKNAGGSKPLPKDAPVPAGQLVKTGADTVKPTSPPAKQGKITPAETGRFTALHKVVRGGLKKMSKLSLEVADALDEILDQHLYRGEYKTFKAYCAAELDIQKSYAHDLAKAGAIHRGLQSAMADKSALPINERQIRPLTKLKVPAQQVKAWKKAQELAQGGKVTEALVRKAVKELQPPKAEKLLPPPAPEPDTTWRDRLVTKIAAMGFESVFEQPIKWPSDAVALYSSAANRYVKFIETLEFTNSACVAALGQKEIRCLVVISATANAPTGLIFSTGEQPQIEKESFPPMFHVMAKALDAVLEMDGTFYRAGDLDDSCITTWAPVSYLDLELPEPSEDSNTEPEAAQ